MYCDIGKEGDLIPDEERVHMPVMFLIIVEKAYDIMLLSV
jgi:hypothetical protein